MHRELVEPTADSIEDDEACELAGLVARRKRQAALRLQQREMLAEPLAPRFEIDAGISRRPRGKPELDELAAVVGVFRADRERGRLRAHANPRIVKSNASSPLGQLELDAAVAAVSLVVLSRIERLELAEAGGNEMLRTDAFRDQILHDGDRAPG